MNFIQEFIHSLGEKLFIALCKEDRFQYLISGFNMSVSITLLAALIGVVIGVVVAILKLRGKGILSTIANGYIAIIRGTPVTVQITIIYFVIFASSSLPKMVVAALAFGLNSGAYVAEIIRAGIMAVDKGQMEAGRSLGLSYVQCMRMIVIPQAIKNVLPALGNEFIVLLKETSIAGYIGLADLNKASRTIMSITYQALVAPLIVAYIYFLMTTILSTIVGKFERRLRASD